MTDQPKTQISSESAGVQSSPPCETTAADAVGAAGPPGVEATVRIGATPYGLRSDDAYLSAMGGEFEPGMVRLAQALVRKTDVVFDIGANIGCTAIMFGALAAEVHAFEPAPSTFAFLRTNIANSGLKNVRLHNCGLGAVTTATTLTFSADNRSGGFVSATQPSAGHLIEPIRLRQLDDLVPELGVARVDLVKIDVEGFEGHVLRGARGTLARHRPLVVSELNHWCLNAFQRTSVPDHLDLLRSIFPILLAVDGDRYLDLHNPAENYIVMYHHINHRLFSNILGAFDEGRIAGFRSGWRHEFAT